MSRSASGTATIFVLCTAYELEGKLESCTS
jgi:hypothetical protein